MKAVIQRVKNASVEVDGKTVGEIGQGLLVFLGVGQEDNEKIAEKIVDKIYGMRIFEDENEKTNLSSSDIGAEILVISQFTLCANCRKGNRPSFIEAAPPDKANELYEYVVSLFKERFKKTETGIFGADMKVSLLNDGPFTIVLDSKELAI
ncbi:MAG: D-tyrosyl-tRNA(Tyr) deacylase [Ruminococcaceae bacterium]|nr:D-tyrosyl-tRNA(Tyr) deacylase [Oscillospiraceae bacterium]